MFWRAILDKSAECIFENFEIAPVKRVQFQNFQKSRGWYIPKITQTKRVITSESEETNKYFVMKLISFNPIQDVPFRGCSWMRKGGRWSEKGPLPKICHTFPTMMKLDTIIPHLKKIQKYNRVI